MPRRTLESTRVTQDFAYRALTVYGRPSQTFQLSIINPMLWSEPHPKVVWADPLSLAATDGIDHSFFSSRY